MAVTYHYLLDKNIVLYNIILIKKEMLYVLLEYLRYIAKILKIHIHVVFIQIISLNIKKKDT